jgi:deoxyribonucleoside regulator
MYSDALLVKASELYYYSRMSQAEIGHVLGVSVPTVSRILQEAMERGIIEVRIRDPLTRTADAEEALKKKFGLLDAVVVEIPQDTDGNFLRSSSEEIQRTAAPILRPWRDHRHRLRW